MNTSFRFDVGSFCCIAVRDLDSDDVGFNSLFVDTGQHKILVDPGLGRDCFPLTTDRGSTVERLRALAIDPADIDLVVHSHADIDHACGGVGDDGMPAFINARYYLLREEWDFWVSTPERLRRPTRTMTNIGASAAKCQLHGCSSCRTSWNWSHLGTKSCRVCACWPPPATRKSTHASRSHQVMSNCSLSATCFTLPRKSPAPSGLRTSTMTLHRRLATRRRIFTAAARDKTLVMGYHLPFPGMGYIGEVGQGWTWTAIPQCGTSKD